MKKKFFAVALATTMAISSTFSAFAENVTLDGQLGGKSIDNPLKGTTEKTITIEYKLTSSEVAAAWQGVAQFCSESDTGWAPGVVLMFWPQMAHNGSGDIAWYEMKGDPEGKVPADTLCDGKEHTYKYILTENSCEIYVDDAKKELVVNADGGKAVEEVCKDAFKFITTADKLILGWEKTENADWKELTGTISSFKVNGNDLVASADNNTATQAPTNNNTATQAPSGNNIATQAPANNNTNKPGKTTPKTGDVAPVAALAAVAVVACAAVVVSKKKVTE